MNKVCISPVKSVFPKLGVMNFNENSVFNEVFDLKSVSRYRGVDTALPSISIKSGPVCMVNFFHDWVVIIRSCIAFGP